MCVRSEVVTKRSVLKVGMPRVWLKVMYLVACRAALAKEQEYAPSLTS